MKKRLSALLLAVISAFVFSSCGVFEISHTDPTQTAETVRPTEAFLTVETDSTGSVSSYEAVEQRHGYFALPETGQRTLYDELYKVYRDVSPEKDESAGFYPMPQVKIDVPLSEAEVRTTIKAIYSDNPELFWAAGTIGYFSDSDGTIVRMYSRYSPQEVDTMLNASLDAVNKFLKELPSGLSEYDRELFTHDYLIALCEYDKDVDPENSDKNDPKIYTVYGALVDKLAVCEGYARAFQLLLNKAGVDCIGISGKGEDELHMWNAVKLGGKWYNVDTTWDDREELYYKYNYFNLSDGQMKEDHIPSPLFSELTEDQINGLSGSVNCDIMNLVIPECGDTTMNLYYRSCPHLADLEGADVTEGLLDTALKKGDLFLFYVEDSIDFENGVDALFKTPPQYFFQYIDRVNASLTDYSIDTSNIGYYSFEKTRLIAVELHYL